MKSRLLTTRSAFSAPLLGHAGLTHAQRNRSALVTTLAVAIAVAACDGPPGNGSDTAAAPTVTIRDSAGIEIVENHAPEHPAGSFWIIDPEPEFVLGGSDDLGGLAGDSAQLVWSVVGVARLPDGRVAVLSSENRQLLLFEPSGELSGTIGRAGEGPGEFTRPEKAAVPPPRYAGGLGLPHDFHRLLRHRRNAREGAVGRLPAHEKARHLGRGDAVSPERWIVRLYENGSGDRIRAPVERLFTATGPVRADIENG